MCVNTGISSCACQILVLTVGYVLVCTSIPILFGKPKINNVDKVALFSQSHEKVVRLDITMNEVLGMNILYPANLKTKIAL